MKLEEPCVYQATLAAEPAPAAGLVNQATTPAAIGTTSNALTIIPDETRLDIIDRVKTLFGTVQPAGETGLEVASAGTYLLHSDRTHLTVMT